jgi:hypothetical protein
LFAITSSSDNTTSEQVAAWTHGLRHVFNPGRNMRKDIAYIPATDLYGNATTGYQAFASGDLYPSGNPYVGQIRVDTPTAVVTASVNAADNQATTANL